MAYRYRSYTGFNMNPLWFLIGLNFIVFVATMVNNSLILLLGLTPAFLAEMPWTIISNMFVHGGIGHFIANMITLFFFGSNLLRLVGQRNFLIIYFLGGLVGSAFYLLLGHPYITAVGASGAVFAVGGALAILMPRLRVIIFPIPIPMPLWVAVIGGFLVLSFLPGIAWQAHLGGLVVGLIAGYLFRSRQRRRF